MDATGTTPDSTCAVRIAPDVGALASAAAAIVLTGAMGTPVGADYNVALAGGTTPRTTYRLLAEPPLAQAIRWNRVRLFFGDERAVPPDHGESNYRMVRETLLDRVPIDKDRVHPMPTGGPTDQDALRYEEEIRKRVPLDADGDPAFDLILLGLGPDGHTASLFPRTEAIHSTDRLVTHGLAAPTGSKRVTFTPRLINAAHLVVFLVSGEGKAEVVRRVLEEDGPVDELPARAIKPKHGSVLWLLDAAAASKLSRRRS